MQHNGRNYIYPEVYKYINNQLNNAEINLIIQTVEHIATKDTCFKYFRKFQIDFENKDKALNSIFKELKEVFFNITPQQKIAISGNNQININYINEIIELPDNRTGLNLLYKYEYIWEENQEDLINTEDMDSLGYGYYPDEDSIIEE